MKFRFLNGKLAFVPAALFLILAYARPERRMVWATIALVFFVIAMRKSRAVTAAGPSTET